MGFFVCAHILKFAYIKVVVVGCHVLIRVKTQNIE